MRLCKSTFNLKSAAVAALFSVFGFAQNVQGQFSFPDVPDTRIIETIEGNNGLVLVGGWQADLEYDTTHFPFLKVIDYRAKQIVKDVNPFPSGFEGEIKDIKSHHDTVYVLVGSYSFFKPINDKRFAHVLRLTKNFDFIDLTDFVSSLNSDIEADQFAIDNNGKIYFSAWRKPFRPSTYYTYYTAMADNGQLMVENQIEIIPGLYGVFNTEEVIIEGDSIYVFTSVGDDNVVIRHSYNYELNSSPYKIGPNNSTALAPNGNKPGSPAYRLNNLNNIRKIGNGYVADALYTRKWIDSSNIYDTTDFGLYYFNQNFDSLKFVNISGQYGFSQNGPGAIDLNEKGKICSVSTLNNVSGRSNTYNEVDWYPSVPESKGHLALHEVSGQSIWKREINIPGDYVFFTEVVATKDGGCLAIGGRYKSGSTNLHDPLFVYADSLGVTSIIENVENFLGAKLWPNPARNQIEIDWKTKFNQPHLVVRDIQGRIVKNQACIAGASSARISVEELQAGFYIMEVWDSDLKVNTAKFQVNH